jgi:hypothetical protein
MAGRSGIYGIKSRFIHIEMTLCYTIGPQARATVFLWIENCA